MKNQLTKNFCLAELTSSETARICHIDNTPSEEVCLKLKSLCENVLQPLREAWGKPIIVTSGYRCPKLNKAVGGAASSQHMLGQAADIHTVSDDPKENKQLYDLIRKLNLPVDQCINEYGYNWIHVSYSLRNRRQYFAIDK